MSDQTAAIHCNGLVKTFKDFKLGPIDLEIPTGQVTGIFGPNGAGKSTLLSLVLGLARAEKGEVSHNPKHSTTAAVLDGVGLMGSVRLGQQLEAMRWLSDTTINQLVRVTTECGISKYSRRLNKQLSLGNRQRAAIADLLLQDPDIAIFDEPLNGLDPEGIIWLGHLLKKLAVQGKTVILASHLLAEAELIVDRCVFMREGSVIFSGSVKDAKQTVISKGLYRARQNLIPANVQQDLVEQSIFLFNEGDYLYFEDPEVDELVEIADLSGKIEMLSQCQDVSLHLVYSWMTHIGSDALEGDS